MTEALREQPAFLAGGQLRDYQLVGVSWMAYAWVNDRNGILVGGAPATGGLGVAGSGAKTGGASPDGCWQGG
jgi:hypothetical protein